MEKKRRCDWDDPEIRKQYDRDWYLKNKKTVIARAIEYRKQTVQKYEEYKRQQKCQDCGTDDFRVIVFHHLENKEGTISEMLQNTSWEKIQEELKKCIPLCANCHAIRHYKERKE